MSETIKPSDLTKEVEAILKSYTDDVREIMAESVEKTGKSAKEEVRKGGDFTNRTGKYRKAWKVEFEDGRAGAHATVYNTTRSNLTSWLEFGHAKAGGGRVTAHPHIAETQENAEKLLVEIIRQKVEAL